MKFLFNGPFIRYFCASAILSIGGGLVLCSAFTFNEVEGSRSLASSKSEVYTLVSVNTASDIDGRGSFRSFVISSTDSFVVYIQDNSSGAIKRAELPTDETSIYYTDESPYGKKLSNTYIHAEKNGFGITREKETREIEYRLYVPENSIYGYNFQ